MKNGFQPVARPLLDAVAHHPHADKEHSESADQVENLHNAFHQLLLKPVKSAVNDAASGILLENSPFINI
jgi:hypothetical protein